MKKISFTILLIICTAIFLFFMTSKEESTYIKHTKIMLDTVVTVELPKESKSDQISEEIFHKIAHYEEILSPQSIHFQNMQQGEKHLPSEIFDLVKIAKAYTIRTEGLFDLTIGRLTHLWDFQKKYVPTDDEIKKAQTFIGKDLYELDEEKKTIKVKKDGVTLDFGGIAKGFIASEIEEILIERKVHSALISLGTSTILAHGEKEDHTPWHIGLKTPRTQDKDKIFAILRLQDKVMSLAGDDEKYFIKDGIYYHHILDPRTGKPSDSHLQRAIVIIDRKEENAAILSDLLSTSLFIMGKEKALNFSKTLPKAINILLLTDQNEIYMSESLRKDVKILDSKFKIESIE